MASIFAVRYRKAIASTKIGVRATATEADSVTATITAGDGAPTATEPNGSMYLRRNATNRDDAIYMRIGGSWVAIDGEP
jgi:hypothetical protein